MHDPQTGQPCGGGGRAGREGRGRGGQRGQEGICNGVNSGNRVTKFCKNKVKKSLSVWEEGRSHTLSPGNAGRTETAQNPFTVGCPCETEGGRVSPALHRPADVFLLHPRPAGL